MAVMTVTGCFVSVDPLISPETADHPFAVPLSLTRFHWLGGAWQGEGKSTLTQSGAFYTLTGVNGETRFLVKQIDPDRYIAQTESADRKEARYQYALLVRVGPSIEEYVFDHSRDSRHSDECASLSDEERARLGVRVNDVSDCAVTSLASLRQVFLELLQSAERPKFRYVIG